MQSAVPPLVVSGGLFAPALGAPTCKLPRARHHPSGRCADAHGCANADALPMVGFVGLARLRQWQRRRRRRPGSERPWLDDNRRVRRWACSIAPMPGVAQCADKANDLAERGFARWPGEFAQEDARKMLGMLWDGIHARSRVSLHDRSAWFTRNGNGVRLYGPLPQKLRSSSAFQALMKKMHSIADDGLGSGTWRCPRNKGGITSFVNCPNATDCPDQLAHRHALGPVESQTQCPLCFRVPRCSRTPRRRDDDDRWGFTTCAGD